MVVQKIGRAFATIAILATVLLTAGCGSGSTNSTQKSTELSAQFLRPQSPNNKYVTFGAEAPVTEREAASKVLAENLEAREAANFAAQCATLDLAEVEEVAEERGNQAKKICTKALRITAEPLKGSEKVRADPLVGRITALRVNGLKAYALFHGIDKIDYAVPMTKEGGDWKVGAILMTELGKSQSGAPKAASPSA